MITDLFLIIFENTWRTVKAQKSRGEQMPFLSSKRRRQRNWEITEFDIYIGQCPQRDYQHHVSETLYRQLKLTGTSMGLLQINNARLTLSASFDKVASLID